MDKFHLYVTDIFNLCIGKCLNALCWLLNWSRLETSTRKSRSIIIYTIRESLHKNRRIALKSPSPYSSIPYLYFIKATYLEWILICQLVSIIYKYYMEFRISLRYDNGACLDYSVFVQSLNPEFLFCSSCWLRRTATTTQYSRRGDAFFGTTSISRWTSMRSRAILGSVSC